MFCLSYLVYDYTIYCGYLIEHIVSPPYTVYTIVKQHRGHIGVDSQEGDFVQNLSADIPRREIALAASQPSKI